MDRLGYGLALVAGLIATPALAEWTSALRDDGALFYGGLRSNPADIAILCVGPSAGGRNPVEVDAHEVGVTPIYSVRFEITSNLVPFIDENAVRNDVILWLDGAGYQFPTVTWNALDWIWNVNVALADPLIGALQRAEDLVIGAAAGPHYRMDTSGLADALTEARAFCVNEYVRLGHPVPAALQGFVAPGSQERGGDTIQDLAGYAVRQACGGGAQTEPGYMLEGNIDGDGEPDVVIDWGKIRCTTGLARPFCGAAMCSADVYLSGSYPLSGQPENLLALGVQLIPLSNGAQGVQVGGSLASCNSAGKGNACQFLWYWSGTNFERLQ